MASDQPTAWPETIIQLAKDNGSVNQNDPFWEQKDIDATRWSQSFPYQLMVVKKNGNLYSPVVGWRFTLPIPPESLSISTPFAISTSVTLGGLLEEHNAAPLKSISFSGTTGVLPLRGSGKTTQSTSFFGAITAGTLAASSAIGRSAQALANSAGLSVSPLNLVSSQEITAQSEMGRTSGYFQIRLLLKFLENYAAFKKKRENSQYRLAFCQWKDEAVYLVTPQSFDIRRSASSALEYSYSVNLKAWRRVNLDSQTAASADVYTPIAQTPNGLARGLKAIDDIRRLLQGVRETILAVRGDVNAAIFEPLRKTSLCLKNILGVPIAMSDVRAGIVQDYRDAIITAFAAADANLTYPEIAQSNDKKIQDAFNRIAKLGANGSISTASNSAALDPFRNPDKFYDLFAALKPGSLNGPRAASQAIAQDVAAAQRMTAAEFTTIRDNLIQLSADFSDGIGLGNAAYDKVYDRIPRTRAKVPTDRDYQVVFALNQAVTELSRLAASRTINRFRVDSMQYLAGLARRSGIAFTEPRSKFAVPFPYGSTLENLANKYLGAPDRWLEIAALNGLRSPYVDEMGFDLPLLTNGSDNSFCVGSAQNLFVGQQVWLGGQTVPRTVRRITRIDVQEVDQVLITVDGDPDLAQYTVIDRATMHAFLPDTVNSMQLLYIPSDQEPGGLDHLVKDIPGINQFDPLIRVGGIDLLLTSGGDLVITPDGDAKLAIGLQNILQNVRIKLSVPVGSLLQHPDFGIGIEAGQSTADLDAKQLSQLLTKSFASDPTFSGVGGISVVKNGPTASLSMSLQVAGTSEFIPVSLDIGR